MLRCEDQATFGVRLLLRGCHRYLLCGMVRSRSDNNAGAPTHISSRDIMIRTLQSSALMATAALLLGTGCATITRSPSQTWSVETTPIGATASLSNGERCETPCTLKLRRKYPFALELCKPGFARVETTVQSGMSGAGGTALAGNVLIGGLIGAGIDAGTGAMKDLKPNPMVVVLEQDEPGCQSPNFPPVPKGGQPPKTVEATGS